MRWGTLERVPQTPQNFSKTGLRLPGIGTFRAFLCLFLRGEAVVGGGVPVTEEERKKIGTAHRFRSRATIKKSGKVLGGSGDSFKSPPAHPCPLRALAPQAPPMPLPAQPRGCKGRSPLHKKTKNPPFPPGRGVGGWGQKSKPKAGLAGDKEGTSPAGQRQGKVSQRGGELFQESPGASLSPSGATAVLPQKRRRRSASDRGSPTAHRSAQCGGKSWR